MTTEDTAPATTDAARLAVSEVGLTYPTHTGDPLFVAYAWFKVSDGAGFVLLVKGAKLLRNRDTGAYFVQMPSEPKLARCREPGCGGRNATHARYCNWCRAELRPDRADGWFIDVVQAANTPTRAAITAALAAEHERRAVPK